MIELLSAIQSNPMLSAALMGAMSKWLDAGVAMTRGLWLHYIGLSAEHTNEVRKVEHGYLGYAPGPSPEEQDMAAFILNEGEAILYASWTRGIIQNGLSTLVDFAGVAAAGAVGSPELFALMYTRVDIDIASNSIYWPIKAFASVIRKHLTCFRPSISVTIL